MGLEFNWQRLCETVRAYAETCAQACPGQAAKFTAEAASFCAQEIPQSSPQMQMRNLAYAGVKGVWDGRLQQANERLAQKAGSVPRPAS